jgi:hypothetical protein
MQMTDRKMRWGEQIPILQDYASKLLSLAEDVVSTRSGPYEADDGTEDFLGAMADIFSHKQIDHLKSICILVDAGQYPDAEIISRSSVEGMYLLLWSVYGPKDNPGKIRPSIWWAYQCIEEYRRLAKCGVDEIDLEKETIIFQYAQKYGHLCLSEKAKGFLKEGKPLPDDPYIKRWPDKDYSQIVAELKELGQIEPKLLHYEGIYRGFSQWSHWTARGIGRVFSYETDHISHNVAFCEFIGAGAITVGLEALGRSISLLNDHFKLGFQDKITDWEISYFGPYPQN